MVEILQLFGFIIAVLLVCGIFLPVLPVLTGVELLVSNYTISVSSYCLSSEKLAASARIWETGAMVGNNGRVVLEINGCPLRSAGYMMKGRKHQIREVTR